MLNKKAQIATPWSDPWPFFFKNWPEFVSFLLMVIGFFVAILAGSAVIAYTLILLAGFMGGRIWFRVKTNLKVPWSIILMGFLVGFMVGSRYGDKRMIVIFYILGIVASYYLHDRGIIKSIEY
jgi:hypothetical protein|tara:strand:- start:1812 stop:2180 length:369 start_codon:yes stop_codon:yes gene_type:complete